MLNQIRQFSLELLMHAPQKSHFDRCHCAFNPFVAVFATRPVQGLPLVIVGKNTKYGRHVEMQVDILDPLGNTFTHKSEVFRFPADNISDGDGSVQLIVLDHVLAAEYQFKASGYPGGDYILG